MIRYILASLLAFSQPASAQSFNAGLADWLAGEDLPALQIIANAAAGGDVDARLFLSTVEHMGELHGDAIAVLTREGRIALFRAPSGLSGQSWLDELEGDLPALIRDIGTVTTTPETVSALHAMGERRLAREALRAQAKREYFDLVEASLALVPEMRTVVAGLMPSAPDAPPLAGIQLQTNPDAILPRAVCGEVCADICLEQIVTAIGGHTGLMQLGSPVAALIPEDVWNDSARARISVAGLARLRGNTLPACVN